MGNGSLRTAISVVDDDGSTLTMYQSNWGPRLGATEPEKWYLCRICGFSCPESDAVFVGGATYCSSCSDEAETER